MKVSETSNQMPDLPKQPGKVKGKGSTPSAKGSAVKGKGEVEFSQTFLDATEALSSRPMEAILADLDLQGERLAANQNFEELQKYKKLVTEFMRKASAGIAKLKLTDGGSGRSNQKVHVILEKIDRELEELARQVLGRQTPQLRILEKMDEIRGLLLDLYK